MPQVNTLTSAGAGLRARTALRATASLSTLAALFQGATAGQIISGNESAVGVHGSGAIAFHVLSGLMMISAAMLWWAVRGSVWPTVISALVFAVSFLQAYLGDSEVLTVHVPLALVLLLGAVWVLAWSFGRANVSRSGA